MKTRVRNRASEVPQHTHTYECTVDACNARFEINLQKLFESLQDAKEKIGNVINPNQPRQ